MKKVETKLTTKEIGKIEISELLKNGYHFSVKEIHSELKSAEIKISLDTIRKSLSELIEEKTVLKNGDKKSGYSFSAAPIKKKRGWKSVLIRRLFQLKNGGKITRTTLAKMIQSDERNTHILVSCILKNTDFGGRIIAWDKKEKSYVY